MASSYGRQWIHPRASNAFSRDLVKADTLASKGESEAAYIIYKKRAGFCEISSRRLKMARKQILKAGDSILKIAFIDWYPSPEKDIRFIQETFEKTGQTTEITSIEDCDLLIAAPYGNKLFANKEIRRDKLTLFISGENLSPSYDFHDFSLTTRANRFSGKNARLPQWYSEFNIKDNELEYIGEHIEPKGIPNNRDIAISVIYNNSTPEREEIIALLQNVFGESMIKVFGSHRGGHVNKMKILARSKINICFENSIGSGYVTEKLLHSKIAKCKSLYWGDISAFSDFTNEGVYNYSTRNSEEEIIEWCKKEIEETVPTIRSINIDETIFQNNPTLNPIKDHLRRWSNLIINWRRLKI